MDIKERLAAAKAKLEATDNEFVALEERKQVLLKEHIKLEGKIEELTDILNEG